MAATLTPDAIEPGTQIRITVAREPRAAAARKTIVRLLGKDDAVAAEHDRLRTARQKNQWENQRGGRVRLWQGRQVKLHPVTGARGETGSIRATVDVLRDLPSVAKYLDIAAA
ncbi:MAG: hypothetical protein AAGA57_08925 [Planctomycetota bacterium]